MQQLDALFRKLADGVPLSPIEKQELELIGRDLDKVRFTAGRWVGMNGQPDVKYIHAQAGRFSTMPNGFFERKYFSVTTPLSIPDATFTTVTYTHNSGASNTFVPEEGTGNIKVIDGSTRYIGAIGRVHWDVNATGFRLLDMFAYASDSTLLFQDRIMSYLPNGIADDHVSFAAQRQSIAITAGDVNTLEFRVYQNSGGALDLHYFTVGLFLLK